MGQVKAQIPEMQQEALEALTGAIEDSLTDNGFTDVEMSEADNDIIFEGFHPNGMKIRVTATVEDSDNLENDPS